MSHLSSRRRRVNIYDDSMSARVKRQARMLKALAKNDSHVCKAILKGVNKDLLKCLSECAYIILRGNAKLAATQKTRLTKYKQKLRKVGNKKTSLKQKQKLVQTGGFLPALLAPLLTSVIAPLAGEAVKGIVKAVTKKRKRKHG